MPKKSKRNAISGGVAIRSVKPNTSSEDEQQLLTEAIRLHHAGDFAAAIAYANKAKSLFPKRFGAYGLLGQLAISREQYQEALENFDTVMSLEPRHHLMRGLRAMVLLKLGRAEEAKTEAEFVLAADPAMSMADKVLGMYFDSKKQFDQAEVHFRRVIQLKPEDHEGYALLGKILIEQEREAEARVMLKQAIKLNPRAPAPFYLMGSLLRRSCRFRTGFSFFRHAHRLDPLSEAVNINYAVGLADTGQVHEAIRILRAYLEKHPDSAQTRFNLANFLLLIGQLDEGWMNYEARRVLYTFGDLPFPDWQGEPFGNKTIVVRAEQGIGDEIWCASMFDDLIKLGGQCFIECEPRLYTLFSRSFPTATFLPKQKGKMLLPADHLPDLKTFSASLPRWLRGDFSKFPGKVGFLTPDPGRAEFWRWRLAQLGNGLKVGISWRSVMTKGTRRDNYTTLDEWGEIFETPNAVFINLQYGECQDELDEAAALFGVEIVNFKDIDLKDALEDVAALISELDVVVAPCNAVGAFGGALDVPVLQFMTNSGWNCLGKDYDPWYPSVRVFFRAWDRDWSEALRAVAVDLKRRSHQNLRQITAADVDAEREMVLLRSRISRGAIMLNSGKATTARAICEEILAVRPDHADALILMGVVDEASGERSKAERAFRRVIELEPLYTEAYNHLGALLLKAQRRDEAIAEFRRALELRPNYTDALNNLGCAHAAKTEFNEAIKCYQRAIATYSGYVKARYNYALALEDSGRADEAIVEYETVVESNPRHADAWNNLGNLYSRMKRDDEALNAYRKAIAANPALVGAQLNLAKKILTTSGSSAEAIDLLKSAVAVRPDDVRIIKTLGVAYAMNEEFELAVEHLQSAIKLAPNDSDAHRNLGLALQKAGRLEEARNVLAQAVLLMAAERGLLPPGGVQA